MEEEAEQEQLKSLEHEPSSQEDQEQIGFNVNEQ